MKGYAFSDRLRIALSHCRAMGKTRILTADKETGEFPSEMGPWVGTDLKV